MLPREFRAAWVASVANIDWPSARDVSAGAVVQEIELICQTAADIGLNALIVQMRPAGDALYASKLEPWSEYLTGEQGRAPAMGLDPLAHWVLAARARNLQIHVWFNPYRAQHASAKSPLHSLHFSQREPDAVVRYGDQLWMDPSHPAAQAHSLAVIADVVRRYDIAGIHIDDYFYPYPISAKAADGSNVESPFPDAARYAAYQNTGGQASLADWRRGHVNAFVQALFTQTKATKPNVLVGISPFGIGQPQWRPAGITGFSQFDKLYADVELWLREGWMDYLAPQLYWPIEQKAQAFDVLLDYWLAQAPARIPIYPGLYTSRVGDGSAQGWEPHEIVRQIELTRSRAARGANGHIHFSMKPLLENRKGMRTALQTASYV
jgi:uncharacterized lipoprotein YddW (UPF0748 family)